MSQINIPKALNLSGTTKMIRTVAMFVLLIHITFITQFVTKYIIVSLYTQFRRPLSDGSRAIVIKPNDICIYNNAIVIILFFIIHVTQVNIFYKDLLSNNYCS